MKARFVAFAFAALAAVFAACAHAEYHLFRVNQIYSNSDGSVQYLVMRESFNANGEHLWGGITLVTTNMRGQRKELFFPTDLRSQDTAGRSVLIATQGFAAWGS